jgi:hypothetical protein
MLAFETAIVLSHFTGMRTIRDAKHAAHDQMELRRAARSGLLGLVSALGALSLFFLFLDISAGQVSVAANQQAPHQPISKHGVNR